MSIKPRKKIKERLKDIIGSSYKYAWNPNEITFLCENNVDLFEKNGKEAISLLFEAASTLVDAIIFPSANKEIQNLRFGNIYLGMKILYNYASNYSKKFPNDSISYRKYLNVCKSILDGDISLVLKSLRNIDDVDFRHLSEYSPLVFACILNLPEIVKILLEKGASAKQEYCLYHLPFPQIVIKSGHFNIIKILFNNNAFDVNEVIRDRHIPNRVCSAVQAAIDSGNVEVVRFFIENDFNLQSSHIVSIKNCNIVNAFHYAVIEQEIDIVEYFLSNQIFDVNSLAENNNNVLHLCSSKKNMYGPLCILFKLLLEYGANINIINNSSENPQHICGRPECAVINYFKKLHLIDPKNARAGIEIVMPHLLDSWHALRDSNNQAYKNELQILKATKIEDKSLLDLLYVDKQTADQFIKNGLISELFKRNYEDFRTQFPFYGFILNIQLQKCQERYFLTKTAGKTLQNAFGTKIPEKLNNKILQNLNNAQLTKISE